LLSTELEYYLGVKTLKSQRNNKFGSTLERYPEH